MLQGICESYTSCVFPTHHIRIITLWVTLNQIQLSTHELHCKLTAEKGLATLSAPRHTHTHTRIES